MVNFFSVVSKGFVLAAVSRAAPQAKAKSRADPVDHGLSKMDESLSSKGLKSEHATQALTMMMTGKHKELATKVFDHFDDSGKGHYTHEDLEAKKVKMVKKEHIEHIDKNKDGKIDKEEHVDAMSLLLQNLAKIMQSLGPEHLSKLQVFADKFKSMGDDDRGTVLSKIQEK